MTRDSEKPMTIVFEPHGSLRDLTEYFDCVPHSYLKEVEALLKTKFAADVVHVFDYTRRRVKEHQLTDDRDVFRPPANNAHIDQTPGAALSRVRLHFGVDGEKLLHGRLQLVNVWRPTFGPLEESPLAVCDARTLSKHDLVISDLVYPHYVGENYNLKWNDNQRWYYLKDMQADECILIKNFDSRMDGRARCKLCPHSAFLDHNSPKKKARLRESIEIRAMVDRKTPVSLRMV